MTSNTISDARLAEMIAEQRRWLDAELAIPTEAYSYHDFMEAAAIIECAIYEMVGFLNPTCEGGAKLARIRHYLLEQAEIAQGGAK